MYGADSMARRHTIANAQAIVRVTKGRNVILSSGVHVQWAGIAVQQLTPLTVDQRPVGVAIAA